MKVFERILEKVSPGYAAKRIQGKAELKIAKFGFELMENYMNYNNHGASLTKNAFRGSDDGVYSADEDIGESKTILMARSRQLYMGSNIATGAIKKIRTNVVGRGIKLKSKINNEILQLSDKEVERVQRQIQTIWNLWADSSSECDITGQCNFYQIQSLAILTQLIDGECFILMPFKKRAGGIFDLKLQLVDSARCMNYTEDYITGKIRNGVEIDSDGRPIAYYFLKDYYSSETIRVSVYTKSGRKNVLVLMEKERIGQRRGVPLLAPVIEALHQIGKFSNAELVNAVVSSIFSAFIKKATPTSTFSGMKGIEAEKDRSNLNLKMGSGTVIELNEGEDIIFADPKRPNSNFETFLNAVCKEIGTALEIPLEVLLSHFNASYSASKAALEEVWKMYLTRREWLASQLCQPVFEELIDEAVAKGLIKLEGYDNILKRKAYLQAEWYGETQSQLDPLKEVKAARERIELGISTIATESRAINGSDWEDNIKQRALEEKRKEELGLNVSKSSGKER